MFNIILVPCLAAFMCFVNSSSLNAEEEKKENQRQVLFTPAVIYFDADKIDLPCLPEIVSDKSKPQANIEQTFVIKG